MKREGYDTKDHREAYTNSDVIADPLEELRNTYLKDSAVPEDEALKARIAYFESTQLDEGRFL